MTAIVFLLLMMSFSCSREQAPPVAKVKVPRPSILLVTLDTTRADSMGFESTEVETPALDALAARGIYFSQAWTTAPMTLPSHTSMLTGLYPSQHGIHENSRFLDEDRTLLAERLERRGLLHRGLYLRIPAQDGSSVWRGASITTTTTSARATRNEPPAPPPSGRFRICERHRKGPSSSGSTISIHTTRTLLRSRSDRATRRLRTSARSPIWTRKLGRLIEAFESRNVGADIEDPRGGRSR